MKVSPVNEYEVILKKTSYYKATVVARSPEEAMQLAQFRHPKDLEKRYSTPLQATSVQIARVGYYADPYTTNFKVPMRLEP